MNTQRRRPTARRERLRGGPARDAALRCSAPTAYLAGASGEARSQPCAAPLRQAGWPGGAGPRGRARALRAWGAAWPGAARRGGRRRACLRNGNEVQPENIFSSDGIIRNVHGRRTATRNYLGDLALHLPCRQGGRNVWLLLCGNLSPRRLTQGHVNTRGYMDWPSRHETCPSASEPRTKCSTRVVLPHPLHFPEGGSREGSHAPPLVKPSDKARECKILIVTPP